MITAVSEHLDIINCISIEYPRYGWFICSYLQFELDMQRLRQAISNVTTRKHFASTLPFVEWVRRSLRNVVGIYEKTDISKDLVIRIATQRSREFRYDDRKNSNNFATRVIVAVKMTELCFVQRRIATRKHRVNFENVSVIFLLKPYRYKRVGFLWIFLCYILITVLLAA
jgi:hypothetical protein